MCGPLLRRFLGRHLMLCLGLGIVLVMSLAALCAPLLDMYCARYVLICTVLDNMYCAR